ncbi:MAG TPA: monodechloroaminopyrrolnitrin synthase PrnB family protein [Steroidobacteraceae bacterium]|nr:monodechloroaminopyrrolnitrin synthase PrnB family protein [Steroidobacteraceae bacterium]
MSNHSDAFDHWIRGSFAAINTELENLYFAQDDRSDVSRCGGNLKAQLRDEGHVYVVALLAEGDTGDGFETAFSVLGNVGMYLAALRRHELTNPAREERSPFPEASSLAMHVGAALGMAPRFSTAHIAHLNFADAGVRKSFTSLADEILFIDENTRGILLLQLAADALAKVVPLGISSPIVDVPFAAARHALAAVIESNQRLFDQLDVERFFFSVRPYYKPYMVGRQQYRGANAGDFSGINELDLLLGLCRANDPYYAQLLVDKMQFMPPQDQARLRECMRHESFLDEFLALAPAHAGADWFRRNARAYLELCELFGRYASQHHDYLVKRFIEAPASKLGAAHLESITASGPPLPVLLRSLEVLRDMRLAANRPDIATRHADLERLRKWGQIPIPGDGV